ncbi:MAG: glyoxalase [Pleurocapsa sp. SU_196_0]|nr:glyoxalase [Pleurocapsa sp. SU_196_0]
MIRRLHHAQVTVPASLEGEVREFYLEVLGLEEVAKPESLKARGGFWVRVGDAEVHVSLEENVERLRTKAHLAYEVTDISAWRARLEAAGHELLEGVPIPGYERFETRDAAGNRLEFIARV